ncbi:MAG TPA: prephenate dehydratase domain-containing protein [Candidatus Limnocylindria bacterium]|nr:prephenate dehydratase domain-containing protein [Candidatus Limnocylindria bacterium]
MTGGVAYAGEAGAFAEDAAIAVFGDAPRLPVGSFREVFEAVQAGRASAGVVPIENLVNGSIRETYDLLLEHDLVIDAEVVVPVDLCLAGLPDRPLESIERVYSHIQALGQAERFLRARPWALLTTYNTAGAGRFIVDRADDAAAAVLSRRAATALGLHVLANSIQDVPDNRTRFLVLAKAVPAYGAASEGRPGAPGSPGAPAAADPPAAAGPLAAPGTPAGGPASGSFRTTVAFGVRNEPGTLLAALQVFANRSINLSKLESRPSRAAAWEYVFWADLDAHAADPSCAAALDELRAVATMVRTFGSYPRAVEP